MASNTALTFGVEVEFIVTINKDHESDKETYEAMADIFLRNLANPLPCACIQRKWSKYRGAAIRYPDGKPLDKKDWKDHYCFFIDSSVGVNHKQRADLEAEGKVAIGLEVSTRALDFDKQGCPELKDALTAIRDGGQPANLDIANELKPSPHRTAALHVHVGLKSGLDLDTAKRAAVLAWLLEPHLFSLCDHERGMSSHAPIRKESVLAKTVFEITESDSADDSSKENSVTDTTESDRLDSILKRFPALEKE
ncbi:hypothetical protein F5Y05DRAFT_421953 [Hypoxylon sp. FL0543]|nr:hypothetical protein F5Y05DRAFT_421953 [Hypoxylon sp. FL0543]